MLPVQGSNSLALSVAKGNWRWGLFVRNRFFIAWAGALSVTALGLFSSLFLWVGVGLAAALVVASVVEYSLLSSLKSQLAAARGLEPRMSLGDQNTITIRAQNLSRYTLLTNVVEELPVQFQERNFKLSLKLLPGQTHELLYKLRPVERGAYEFGHLLLFVRTKLGFVERRFHFEDVTHTVAVYPSVFQMRQQALRVKQLLRRGGAQQRQRQMGRSYEFDQIKSYVAGDDYRQLNWKATARANTLMANVFVEERSQQIIAVLDTSRTMLSPFADLSLLDYAINSTLALLNVALLRGDRVGLIAFDRAAHTALRASARPEQLMRILETLYAQKPSDFEPDYEALSQHVQRTVKGRSLLMLYTNFETIVSLERNLPALRRLAKSHLLVVIMFTNAEVAREVERKPKSLEEAYLSTIAAEYEATQMRISSTLMQHGILVLRTLPQQLTANAVTQYLSVKSGGRL